MQQQSIWALYHVYMSFAYRKDPMQMPMCNEYFELYFRKNHVLIFHLWYLIYKGIPKVNPIRQIPVAWSQYIILRLTCDGEYVIPVCYPMNYGILYSTPKKLKIIHMIEEVLEDKSSNIRFIPKWVMS